MFPVARGLDAPGAHLGRPLGVEDWLRELSGMALCAARRDGLFAARGRAASGFDTLSVEGSDRTPTDAVAALFGLSRNDLVRLRGVLAWAHRTLVERRGWLGDREFASLLVCVRCCPAATSSTSPCSSAIDTTARGVSSSVSRACRSRRSRSSSSSARSSRTLSSPSSAARRCAAPRPSSPHGAGDGDQDVPLVPVAAAGVAVGGLTFAAVGLLQVRYSWCWPSSAVECRTRLAAPHLRRRPEKTPMTRIPAPPPQASLLEEVAEMSPLTRNPLRCLPRPVCSTR